MAQNIESSLYTVTLSGTVSDTFALMVPQSTFNISQNTSIANGTGDDEGNFVWSTEGTIPAGGSVTIDLKGTNKDIFCNDVDMDVLKIIVVRNTSDSETGGAVTSKINVTTNGIGFLTGTAPTVHIGSGSVFTTSNLKDGWTLTAGSADTITITNENANAHAAYQAMFLGYIEDASSSSSSYSSASSDSSSSSSSSSSPSSASSASSDSSSSDSSSSDSSSSSSP